VVGSPALSLLAALLLAGCVTFTFPDQDSSSSAGPAAASGKGFPPSTEIPGGTATATGQGATDGAGTPVSGGTSSGGSGSGGSGTAGPGTAGAGGSGSGTTTSTQSTTSSPPVPGCTVMQGASIAHAAGCPWLIAAITIPQGAHVGVTATGTPQGECTHLDFYEVRHNGDGDLGFAAAGATADCPGTATESACCAELQAGRHVLLVAVEGMDVDALDLRAESGTATLASGLSGPATWEHLAPAPGAGGTSDYASTQHTLDAPSWAVFSIPGTSTAGRTWSEPAGGPRHNGTLQGISPLGHAVAAGAWRFGLESVDGESAEARLGLLRGAGAFSAW
jgi:hypothetical protein